MKLTHLSVALFYDHAECHYAERHFNEFRYDECHSTEFCYAEYRYTHQVSFMLTVGLF